MKPILLFLLAATALFGCGAFYSDTSALYPGKSPTQQAMRQVCGHDEGALCVTVEQLALFGIAKDTYWGKIKYDELGFVAADPDGVIPLEKIAEPLGLDPAELAKMKVRAGLVIIEGDRCDADPVTCRGVLRHEFGHLRRGPSQIDADCYAARTGTKEEVAALLKTVSTFNDPKRTQALTECAKE